MLGLKTVYRIGGPAGIAALAYGTETVKPVDLIAGPGHPVVVGENSETPGPLWNATDEQARPIFSEEIAKEKKRWDKITAQAGYTKP